MAPRTVGFDMKGARKFNALARVSIPSMVSPVDAPE